MGPATGRGVPAGPDAWRGLATQQHRRRSADGDGARRRPGQHGRGMVGAHRADPRRHVRRPSAQPQRAARAHPPAKHHRQPGGQAVPQRSGRVQLDGGPVPLPRPASSGTPTTRRGSCSTPCTSSTTDSSGWNPDGPVPDWFCQSADLAELGEKTGIDAAGLARTLARLECQRRRRARPRFRPRRKRLRRLLG